MSSNEDVVAALRGETKARKALSKLGLKPVEGFTRVVLKKNKGGIVVIPVAEIFKSATSETYVIYGASHAEDPAQQQFLQQQQQQLMMQQAQAQSDANDALLAASNSIQEVDEDKAGEDDDSAEVDEEGLKADDIQVIMDQASRLFSELVSTILQNRMFKQRHVLTVGGVQQSKCSRGKAAKALRAADGDVIAAIMSM